MSKSVSVSSFGSALSSIIEDFQEVEENQIQRAVRSSGTKCRNGIQSGSPELTGKYAGGWTSKAETELGGYYVVVYNKTSPGLAHLLEKGHANRGGGRTPAYPHIAPAYQEAAADLKRRLS